MSDLKFEKRSVAFTDRHRFIMWKNVLFLTGFKRSGNRSVDQERDFLESVML